MNGRSVIGVIAKEHQHAAVEEFFQLFKTPWESWRRGEAYDVVVATADEIPDAGARLLVSYGAREKPRDLGDGFVAQSRQRGGVWRYRDVSLPIYGNLLTFGDRGQGVPHLENDPAAPRLNQAGGPGGVVRIGYDLFDEVAFLLSSGQPPEHASVPTLDLHIAVLRESIVGAGIPLVEIPPAPSGYRAIVCLTHDIDFAGIRYHKLDHTMWGFLHRSTAGALHDLWRGRRSLRQMLRNWWAAVSLPLVYLGWAADFWEPFAWYMQAEHGLPATYFLIPFKRRSGERIASPHARRRATAYDIGDLAPWTRALLGAGCELGVHGIDAWHAPEKGRAELERIAQVSGQSIVGVRMHWLLRDDRTVKALEAAGYTYDSSLGYNETIGYLNGTGQVFRPPGAQTLLEVPLHVQDGALFSHDRLDLSEAEAWVRCAALINHARQCGGVLTLLWHDRSHAPERLWGDFYVRLLQAVRSLGAWFATASQAAAWFGARRSVRFERSPARDGTFRIDIRRAGGPITPPLTIRFHRELPGASGADNRQFVDVAWDGQSPVDLGSLEFEPAAATAAL